MARPSGRAQAIASIQVVTARSRAVRPGRRSARSASRIATRSSPPRPKSRTSSGPPTRISPCFGSAGHRPGPSRCTGTDAARIAHSSTRSRPPRRRPKSCAPQCAAPHGLAHDASNPALLRAEQPATGRARRRLPARPADRGDAVARERREQERAFRLAERPHQPRGPSLEPGLHDLDRGPPAAGRRHGGQAERRGLRRRAHRREHDRGAGDATARQGHVAHVVVGRPVLAKRRMGLARDHDQAELRHRREHRRAGAHHDVEGARLHVEPRSVPAPLRATEQRRAPRTERRLQRPRHAGDRFRLRHDHERAPTGAQARVHRLDHHEILVFGGGTQRERLEPGTRDRPEQGVDAPVARQGRRRRTRSRRAGGRRILRPPPTRPAGASPARAPRPAARRSVRSPSSRARGRRRRTTEPVETAFLTGEHPLRQVVGGSQHPASDRPPVERHLDQRADAGAELGVEPVGERPVERQDRAVDADRDRAVEDLGLVDRGATRRRRGGRRRGRSPPRGTPCARSARRRPSPGRSAGRGRGRG